VKLGFVYETIGIRTNERSIITLRPSANPAHPFSMIITGTMTHIAINLAISSPGLLFSNNSDVEDEHEIVF